MSLASMIPSGLRKWFAIGSGVGIQIVGPKGSESLQITAVTVRPGGARVRGGFTIEDFRHQPAAAWGASYSAFLRKLGMGQVVATVLLPRHDVIVRPLALPGVSDKDLAGAIQFQVDGLHPYNEEDVLVSWERLPGTSTVLVAIARRDTLEKYIELFAEAGIKLGNFTCSAAAIYSGLRLHGVIRGAAPPKELLASDTVDGVTEVYGESPARPVFSASFPGDPARAAAMASAELRVPLSEEFQPRTFAELLGVEKSLSYAAALLSACPRLGLHLNVLPVALRQTSSPMMWVPAAVLGAVVLILAGAMAALPSFEEKRYLKLLQDEISQVLPGAERSAQIDREIETVRRNTQVLDQFRARPKSDMDVLAELTRLLPPTTWVNLLEVTPTQVTFAGETDQAAPLLKLVDASPMFQGSEFFGAPQRLQGGGEGFRIRTNREQLAAPPSAAPQAAAPVAGAAPVLGAADR